MAGRIRSIKPEILEDERSASLSSDAWRLWVCMWIIADDHGNLRGDSRRLAADVFWACPHPVNVSDLLEELSMAGLVARYSVRGQSYISIANWKKHQRIDNSGKPRVPGPDDEESSEFRGESPRVAEVRGSDLRPRPTTTTPITLPDSSPSAPLELVPSAPLLDFDALYAPYPRKEGKAKGMAKLKRVITTPAQYERFANAVRNYAKHVAGRPADKVKHFDSFVSCWEDYADGLPFVASAVPQSERQYKNFQAPRSAVAESKDVKL